MGTPTHSKQPLHRYSYGIRAEYLMGAPQGATPNLPYRSDAVVLVLYEPQQTWAGSLHRRKDTCAVKALAITAAGKTQPVLWSSQRLPSDSFAIKAVPTGGAVILSTSLIIYQNKVRHSILQPLKALQH
jgi:hypothetical protein